LSEVAPTRARCLALPLILSSSTSFFSLTCAKPPAAPGHAYLLQRRTDDYSYQHVSIAMPDMQNHA